MTALHLVPERDWHTNWLPGNYPVPMTLMLGRFRLVPLTPGWNEEDYQAVMASRDMLRNLFRQRDSWPADNHSRVRNREDLAWHEAEFRQRRSFAWAVLDEQYRYLGCAYLYPSRIPAAGAEAFFWVRRDDPRWHSLEVGLQRLLVDWFRHWPLADVIFPGRNTPWHRWPASHWRHYGEVWR